MTQYFKEINLKHYFCDPSSAASLVESWYTFTRVCKLLRSMVQNPSIFLGSKLIGTVAWFPALVSACSGLTSKGDAVQRSLCFQVRLKCVKNSNSMFLPGWQERARY